MPVRETAPPRPALVYTLLVLATAFWGGTAVAGKLAIQGFAPFTTGALRYGAAALTLLLVFHRQIPDPARLGRRDRRLIVAVGLIGTFFNHTGFFFALLWAPAAHGSLIAPTATTVSALLLTAWREREPLAPRQLAGIVLCLVGVLLVMRPERLLTTGGGSAVLIGDALFVCSGTSWGTYSYVSKLAMQRLSPAATLALGMLVGLGLLVPLSLLEAPWHTVPRATAVSWVALGYLTVAATVLAFLWWNVGIRRVGPGRTAVFSNLVPVFGVLTAWLVLGERLTALQLVGGALTVAGVVGCQRPA
jgi:drug/metabolite transporter (DMT)-like permease